ncbi:hypothetical protein MBLNU230_g3826t1 [Neophaeotheca triangularis]
MRIAFKQNEREMREEYELDEEKVFLPRHEEPAEMAKPQSEALSRRFWVSAAVNCIATAGIVFVNKHIFSNPRLKHIQVTFAAFHFATTAALLYTLSRPNRLNLFQPKPVDKLTILPLALAMILNVVLPNASLAYSSIQFYQVARVLLTPCVVVLNYLISRAVIPLQAALTLLPVCVGVAVVSYFDTAPATAEGAATKTTTPLGVFFALSGVLASSVYTVWIAKYHKSLACTSMQLLLNQAPVSVLVMLYVIPFADDVTVWSETGGGTFALIGLSGVLACFINLSQFFIINEAGPVSSTVVGHFKTCSIVALGWLYSGKPLKDGSLLGVVLAVGGIVA